MINFFNLFFYNIGKYIKKTFKRKKHIWKSERNEFNFY